MIHDDILDFNEIPEEIINATKTQRFFNVLIDRIILFVVGVGVLLLVEQLGGLVLGQINSFLVTSFISILYYFFFEMLTQRSIGKYITKTKVVTMDGTYPTPKTIFIRSLCRFIPFDAFSFIGESAIGWHDSISKTRVIQVS